MFHAVAEATSVAPKKMLLCSMILEVSRAISLKKEEEMYVSKDMEACGAYVHSKGCGWVDAS